MLPSLSPLSDRTSAGGTVRVPPPPRFRPLEGTPHHISIRPNSAPASVGNSAAKQAGIRYETKVQRHLERLLKDEYVSSPHLRFWDNGHFRTCIPDGIFASMGSQHRDRYFILFEMKSQHMPEAWWQLDQLYKPVLSAFAQKPVYTVEICRSYDPAMPFPVKPRLIPDLLSYVRDPFPEFGVFVCRL